MLCVKEPTSIDYQVSCKFPIPTATIHMMTTRDSDHRAEIEDKSTFDTIEARLLTSNIRSIAGVFFFRRQGHKSGRE